MVLRRAIVQGFDSGEGAPKGVASAVDVRQSVSALAIREGVFFTSDDACEAAGTGTMGVELQSFRAAIESPLGGYYFITEDDVASVELDPADSSNDRIDLICVLQNDYQVDAGETDSEVEYVVVTGTPGVSPVAPAVPTGALALWECEVPANATTTSDGVVFTPRFMWTAAVGARVPVRDVAELAEVEAFGGLEANVLTTPGAFWRYDGDAEEWRMHGIAVFADTSERNSAIPSPHADMRVIADGVEYVYTGSAWRIVGEALLSVRAAAQAIANSSVSSTVVNFDTQLVNAGAFTESSGVLTCVTPGRYRFEAWVEYAANSSGVRMVFVEKALAASPSAFSQERSAVSSADTSTIGQTATVMGVVTVAVGDKLQVGTRQNSGGSLNLVNGGIELKQVD